MIPANYRELDVACIGTVEQVLALDHRTLSRLFQQVDTVRLKALQRQYPDASVELLVGDDVVSLWCADTRVALVPRR